MEPTRLRILHFTSPNRFEHLGGHWRVLVVGHARRMYLLADSSVLAHVRQESYFVARHAKFGEHEMPFNDSNGHVIWTVKVDSAAKCASSETTLPCDGATSPPSDSTRPEGASLAASGDQVCAPGLEPRVSLERMLSA